MVQYFIWYALQIKAWIKRKTSWILLVGFVSFIIICSCISIPDVSNIRVGVFVPDTPKCKEFWTCLENLETIFIFDKYQNEEGLYKDVKEGLIECGFVLNENFDESLKEPKPNRAVTYICTPMTTKGEVVKETIYTVFLQLYGETIIDSNISAIYGDLPAETEEEIRRESNNRYEYYLDHSRLLKMNTVMVDTLDNTIESVKTREHTIYPIHGMIAMILFLILWMEQVRKFESQEVNVCAALDKKRKTLFHFCGNLAVLTVPSIVAWMSVLLFVPNRGFLKESIALIIFVLFTSVWGIVIGNCFKRSHTFLSWTLSLAVVQLLLCPVFIDLSAYFPPLRMIRWIFPVMYYLML